MTAVLRCSVIFIQTFEILFDAEKGVYVVSLFSLYKRAFDKSASSDEYGKKILMLHQELFNADKKRFMCENRHSAIVKSSPIWKNVRKDFRTFSEL